MMTKIKTFWMLLALAIALPAFGQIKANSDENPYIEVTGSADLEVIPDEIYIHIIIQERYVNKEKISIEVQEEKLKNSLREIGVDIKNLYLSDANADYIWVRWRTKDVLTRKDYTLKVTDATMIGKVFQQLEKLEITDASIARVSHSKLDSLKKEVKISAIKAAKSKADYLLNAIGEQTGKPLIIEERESGTASVGANFRGGRSDGVNFRGSSSDGTAYYIDGVRLTGNTGKEEGLQFRKIRVEALIYVKFAIK